MQDWNQPQIITATDVTLSYSASDAPVFVASTSGDLTGSISLGMRLRISQSTGGTKYFIVVAITSSAITLYGGTDYTLTNETISSPVFSSAKAPFGFPLDLAKWTQTTKSTSVTVQSSPASGNWYNPGSLSLNIPIGSWSVQYQACQTFFKVGFATGNNDMYTTLSTANNSESDVDLTSYTLLINGTTNNQVMVNRTKKITVTSKTTYYLNAKATSTYSTQQVGFDGADSPTIISAVCAYL